MGEVVYLRTYSREREPVVCGNEGEQSASGGSASNVPGLGNRETWAETVARVVNGTYNMQRRWIEQHSLGWDKMKAQASAQKMYDKIFNMKFLPPGRGM